VTAHAAHNLQVVLARDGATELRSDAFDKGTGPWFNAKLSSFYDDGPAMCVRSRPI
jgi:hypothetical protein